MVLVESIEQAPKLLERPQNSPIPFSATSALVATTVQLAMVQSANLNGELVADLASHRPPRRELFSGGRRNTKSNDLFEHLLIAS
jgi:hypothetical protein